MKLYTTSFDSAADRHVARASWPLPEPALAYFPNARSGFSDRDLGAGALDGGIAMSDDHAHIPVLLDRCVELLSPNCPEPLYPQAATVPSEHSARE